MKRIDKKYIILVLLFIVSIVMIIWQNIKTDKLITDLKIELLSDILSVSYEVSDIDSGNTIRDTIKAKRIDIVNDEGITVIHLLGSIENGGAGILISDTNTNQVIKLVSLSNGGMIVVSGINVQPGIGLMTNDSGGSIVVFNKTNESIVTLGADDYGNGEVGAFDRSGKGRILQSGQ